MDVVFYTAGIIVLVILAVVAVGAVLSSQAGKKRKEELQTRTIAHQPWEAHGANGRGIR